MNRIYQYLRGRRAIFFGLADVLLIALSLWLAFALRFDDVLPLEYQSRFLYYFLILAALNVVFLSMERLYSFAWEFVSLRELTRLLRAVTYANVLFALIIFILRENTALFAGFPRSIIFINYFLNLIFVGGIRIAKRVWYETVKKRPVSDAPRALIVGADAEGERLIRDLLKAGDNSPFPVAIIDHKKEKTGTSIHGVQVFGGIEIIPEVIKNYNIEHVIVALTAAEADIIREAVKHARSAGIKNVKIIPDTHELLTGRVTLTDLREIEIEDLLGRNPARIETQKISEFVKDKTVLITGAAGSIGSELSRQIMAFQPETLVLLDSNESDLYDLHMELLRSYPAEKIKPVVANIANRDKMFKTVKKFSPDVIFHAAAYKHVPLMEDFPDEAIETNIFGTLNVAEAAIEFRTPKFVLISTDKAIRPTSVMGKTKRAAEIATQELNKRGATKFVSVRFGNVIGSRGSVVPLFKEQIKSRSPLTVTHPDMTRYFMTIPEAALLVMEAGAVGDGGEIFMLDMGKPVKILDVANEMIRLAGLRPDVDIPIVFVGIRPGEKIFEEVVSDEERRVGQTQWDKILITKNENSKPSESVRGNLKNLKSALGVSPEAILTALNKFVS
ncbi:MAG: nucleoside-diphosphate sugar epimerase/dehydratase [Candidatus Jorgensenbacteria bacterium]